MFPKIDAGNDVASVNILDAMRMLIEYVINCFRKAGISREAKKASIEDTDDLFKMKTSIFDYYADVYFVVSTN